MRRVTLVRGVPEAIQERVRRRYEAEIERLSTVGFHEYCFYTELQRPYSFVRDFAIFVMMRMQGEIVSRQPQLRIGGAYALLHHTSPPTLALPMGMGVKFYSGFVDRFALISANFPSMAIPEDNPSVQKHGDRVSLEEAWQLHQRRARDNVALGRSLRGMDFDHFAELSKLEEDALMQLGK